jgi:hypothetical protein
LIIRTSKCAYVLFLLIQINIDFDADVGSICNQHVIQCGQQGWRKREQLSSVAFHDPNGMAFTGPKRVCWMACLSQIIEYIFVSKYIIQAYRRRIMHEGQHFDYTLARVKFRRECSIYDGAVPLAAIPG